MLLGGQSNAQMKSQMSALKDAPSDKPLVICATGKFIGEGFDDSRLDTLFLTMPISWQGTLAQYVGRLHRLHDGKREVRVYDYIDNHAVMLEKCIASVSRAMPGIGYSCAADLQDASLSSDIIYDQITFQERFLQDTAEAKESVVIGQSLCHREARALDRSSITAMPSKACESNRDYPHARFTACIFP